ncbi:MFS general substrate transporter [Hypoxylon sp. FL1150]|nr:MFS general substrate transporter [Hypoxylon sp. FL1150]
MLLPHRIPIPVSLDTRRLSSRNDDVPSNTIFISLDATTSRGRRTRNGASASNTTVSGTNRHNATSQVDRNTSIRSIMTLPAYRTKANENEQVIGREGERDGVDVVVEYPTAEEMEDMRDEEMETLFQIRLARRRERAERDERQRLAAEARSRGDTMALSELAARRRAAHADTTVDELRDSYGQIKEKRQRAVSSVSYHDLGVAQLNGTRVRANSHGSEGMGLLSDAASIALSTRSPSAQSHRRDRSASSVISLNSDFTSPALPSGGSTPRPESNHTRAGSSPEIIGEADLGDADMPPPDYEDVSLDDVRSGATTPMFNEPPPDYADPARGREQRMAESGDLSTTDAARDRSSVERSSRGVGGVPQLPSLRIGRLPEIDSGSNSDTQVGAEFFESSAERTEGVKQAIENTPPLAAAGPPKPLEVPDGGLDAWLQVFGALVVMMATWGLVNTFGVYQTYYETDLLKTSTSSEISWIGSLQGCLLMLGGLVSGPLFDAGYFHALTATGLFLVVFGLFMTSLCTAYYQVLLAQGICVGLGCGLLFLPSAAILSQYFARRRALALGVQSAGSPLGGILFPIIFTRLQPQIGFGWATRVIAFILLGLSVVPLVFMRPRVPPPKHKRAFVDTAALREPPFLMFCASGIAFMGLYVPFFYLQLYSLHYKTVSQDIIPYLVTLLNAGSVFGRILPNFAADYLGSMNMLAATMLGAGVLAFGWFGVHDLAGTVVFALLFGFFNGGVTSLPPSAIVALTPDMSRLGTRMGMTFAFIGVAVLVGTPIAGAILKGADEDGLWRGLIAFSGATLTAGGLGVVVTQLLHVRQMRKTG